MKIIAQVLYEPCAYKHQIISKRDFIDGYIIKFLLQLMLIFFFFLITYASENSIQFLPFLFILTLGGILLLATGKRMYKEAKVCLSVYPEVKEHRETSRKNGAIGSFLMVFFSILNFNNHPNTFLDNFFTYLIHFMAQYHLDMILYYLSYLFILTVIGWMVIGLAAFRNIKYDELESLNQQKLYINR